MANAKRNRQNCFDYDLWTKKHCTQILQAGKEKIKILKRDSILELLADDLIVEHSISLFFAHLQEGFSKT